LGRPRASGSCSQGQGTLCWGKTFRGNRQSRVTRSRRAQGFDPEAEPNRRGQESWTRNCGSGITDQISKGGQVEERRRIGRNRECPQQSKWPPLLREFRRLGRVRVGVASWEWMGHLSWAASTRPEGGREWPVLPSRADSVTARTIVSAQVPAIRSNESSNRSGLAQGVARAISEWNSCDRRFHLGSWRTKTATQT
jgi:hypothetical protein